MRNTHDGNVEDADNAAQDIFDFRWIDIGAASEDHIRGPTHNRQKAVSGYFAQVAGIGPAVLDPITLRAAAVRVEAGRHAGGSNAQQAGGVRWQQLIVFINNLDAGMRDDAAIGIGALDKVGTR